LPPGRGKEWNVTGGFIGAPALMLRLRLGLGVGLRADALSYLLARHAEWLPVRTIAAALGYTEAATRRALDDLSSARLIHATLEGQPTTYFADAKPWCDVLGIATPPKWRGWFEIFALFADLDQLWRSTEVRGATEYAVRALLRQRLSQHRAAFVGLAAEGMSPRSKKLDVEDLEELLERVKESV
jgi:DNA-binding transcriptional ArsR family regulator